MKTLHRNKILYLFSCAFICICLSLNAQESTEVAVNSAIEYLQKNHQKLNANKTDVASVMITDSYTSKHNGVTHVYVRQQHNGIGLFNKNVNINVLKNGRIANMNGQFVNDVASKVNTLTPSISAIQAVESAAQEMGWRITEKIQNLHQIGGIDEKVLVSDGCISRHDIEVSLEYFPMTDEKVRLAWKFAVEEFYGHHLWDMHVDAVDGTILYKRDRIIKCSLDPVHPTPPGMEAPPLSPSPKAAMQVDNSYNVFPIGVESPNHGDRALVVEPWADAPTASPYGWHDNDGDLDPDFTDTRGNNVIAQEDKDANNTGGFRPDGGDNLEFDYELVTGGPCENQSAAVTNMFYWTNVMHDVWYEYGFDEISGNFQEENFEFGGQENDVLNADIQDGSFVNNAQFIPSPDGFSPRIEMFEWGQATEPVSISEITAPDEIADDINISAAAFGTGIPDDTDPIEGTLVLVDDGTENPTLACEELINGDEVEGNIALIDRGECFFLDKVRNAQDAGAVAVVVCNNEAGDPFPMGAPDDDDGDDIVIPAVMISQQTCDEIKLEMPGVEVYIAIELPCIASNRDGAFDSGVVCHEFGHGISGRLTGGPAATGCLSNDEQMGEGISDFIGLVMTQQEGAEGTDGRGYGTFAIGQNVNGVGIRSYRYSTDMNINPHTYGDIANEAIPHGVGSVWGVMLWEMYWLLIEQEGYDEDLYAGTGGNNIAMRLFVDGLKLQPCNPGFVDARDAILLADEINYEGAYKCLIWEAFAKRGLGAGAEQGNTDNVDDGTESFEMPVECSPAIRLTKTAPSESLSTDAVEYTLEVTNNTGIELTNVKLTDYLIEEAEFVDESSDCEVFVYADRLEFTFETMAIGETITCTFALEFEPDQYTQVGFEDDIENGADNWSIDNDIADYNWSIVDNSTYSGLGVWYAEDVEESSDQYLILDDLFIGVPNATLSFYHYYDTEETWDGGVVEISTDGGNDWEDLGDKMTLNGYVGPLQDNPASPISGRDAFHGNSGDYIETRIDLSDYYTEEVQIRFRLGTDGAVGGNGWYIDDVSIIDAVYVTNSACVTSDEDFEACDEVETLMTDPNAGVGTIDHIISDSFSIYPNPASDQINIQLEQELNGSVDILILDIQGKLVSQYNAVNINGTNYPINIDQLHKGMYLLQIKEGNKTHQAKFIVGK